MIKKFKNWIINRFLPVVAREMLVADNERLKAELHQAYEQIDRLKSYINGLETGIKAQRRIIINTGEGKK